MRMPRHGSFCMQQLVRIEDALYHGLGSDDKQLFPR